MSDPPSEHREEIVVPAATEAPYDVVEPGADAAAPPLPGEVLVAEDGDVVLDAISADLFVHAQNCVAQFGDFHLAVSGGAAMQPLFERLMYDPQVRGIPWARTHLWLADERCVPEGDAARKYTLVADTLGRQAGIPEGQVHPMPASDPAGDRTYEQELRDTLGWRERGHDRLDCVILELADDGHVAGLHPGSPAIDEKCWVCFSQSPRGPVHERLTMTPALMNLARLVIVVGAGSHLCGIVRTACDADVTARDCPVASLDPRGVLKWYLDVEAVSDYPGTP